MISPRAPFVAALALALGWAALTGAGCAEQVILGGVSAPIADVCDGAPCGAVCTLAGCDAGPGGACPPSAAMGQCDSAGVCSPAAPTCAPGPPVPACEGKPCGAGCDPCAPGDPACAASPPSGYQCDAAGACAMGPAACGCQGPMCPPPDPCAGKPCGAMCEQCSPQDPMCPPPMQMMVCDPAGACVPAMGSMCPPQP